MALNHFIKKTLGFKLLDPHKPYVDPALKQGARFNKMQHEIIAGVLPDLPLMSQTTGPNLGSIVETLANRKSSQTALEKLDQKEFKTFQTEQDEFNKLLSNLATKHRDLKATEQGIISLDNLSSANYGPDAGKKIKDALFYQNVEQLQDDLQQKCRVPSDPTCAEARATQFYRNQWGCGGGPCAKPSQLKDNITYLNGKIMKQANKIKARAQKLNKLDEKVENEMHEHEQQLRNSLKDLQDANNQKDNLIGSQQTLAGEVIDTRADLDSIYYHYLAWTIAAVTLGALSFHHLMKSK